MLCYTLYSYCNPYIEIDASNTAVGGVLTQEHMFIHKPIDFLRKTPTSSQKKTILFMTVICLQLLLIAKHGTINLMGKEL